MSEEKRSPEVVVGSYYQIYCSVCGASIKTLGCFVKDKPVTCASCRRRMKLAERNK